MIKYPRKIHDYAEMTIILLVGQTQEKKIAKRDLIAETEFMQKLSAERATYQAMLQKVS